MKNRDSIDDFIEKIRRVIATETTASNQITLSNETRSRSISLSFGAQTAKKSASKTLKNLDINLSFSDDIETVLPLILNSDLGLEENSFQIIKPVAEEKIDNINKNIRITISTTFKKENVEKVLKLITNINDLFKKNNITPTVLPESSGPLNAYCSVINTNIANSKRKKFFQSSKHLLLNENPYLKHILNYLIFPQNTTLNPSIAGASQHQLMQLVFSSPQISPDPIFQLKFSSEKFSEENISAILKNKEPLEQLQALEKTFDYLRVNDELQIYTTKNPPKIFQFFARKDFKISMELQHDLRILKNVYLTIVKNHTQSILNEHHKNLAPNGKTSTSIQTDKKTGKTYTQESLFNAIEHSRLLDFHRSKFFPSLFKNPTQSRKDVNQILESYIHKIAGKK